MVREENAINFNPKKEDLLLVQDRSTSEIVTDNKLEISFSQRYDGDRITKINEYQVEGYEEMM